ncbi:permease [Halorientalis pallida]|uniref:permease n=1 Tax=Halorientalis pallida TaxID=2479928 RepID=UPI003C6EB0EA
MMWLTHLVVGWFVDGLVRSGTLIAEMTWDTWWALVLGFALSGAVEAFVSAETMSAYLGGDGWREVGRGTLLGAASSSCSYSAVSTTKTLFRKGASGVASLGAFMFASTDLVIELGLVLWVLLGWEFVVGEYLGGLVAVAVLALLFRHVVPADWIEAARTRVRESETTTCETCNVDVDPADPAAVTRETAAGTVYFCCGGCRRVYDAREDGDDQPLTSRLLSAEGWRSAARAASKDWEMLWTDVALGFVIAGLVGGFVPEGWWTAAFTGGHSFAAVLSDTLVGVGIGVVTVMCSVGNVPFALVLWQNGLSYGAVLAFVYADLLIPPLVNVYRQYYGGRMAATLVVALAVAAVVAGLTVHYLVGGLGLVPPPGEVGGTVPDAYTTALNLLFTPIFVGQMVVTYGWDTVRATIRDRTLRVGRFALTAVARVGRATALAAAALGALLTDPRSAVARVADGDRPLFEFDAAWEQFRTASRSVRAGTGRLVRAIGDGIARIASRLAADGPTDDPESDATTDTDHD